MIIKKVVVRNIRSYISESVSFDTGSTLLAGEIGSGKSSILLAIEFALFGITRGVLSGSSLLRAGVDEGSVELHLEIDGKHVTIMRNLKRSKGDVRQHTGYLIVDGAKIEATPIELKAKILELLGYPGELLTKSKSLIFRYTVYTPQEEMKRILMEQSEYRIDTLRKIFQIDRYKRIRENAQVVVREMKQMKSRLAGQIEDLAEKEEVLKEQGTLVSEKRETLELLGQKLNGAKLKVEEKTKHLRADEDKLGKMRELKSRFDIADTKLREKVLAMETTKEEASRLETETTELLGQINKIRLDKLADLEELEKQLSSKQEQRDMLLKRVAELEKEIKLLRQIKSEQAENVEKIVNLKVCPLCKQDIGADHIEHIKQEYKSRSSEADKTIGTLMVQYDESDLKLISLNNGYKLLKEQISKLQKQRIAQKEKQSLEKSVAEKRERIELLKERQKQYKAEIGRLNSEKIDLKDKVLKFSGLEEKLEVMKRELQQLVAQEKELAIQHAKVNTELESITKQMRLLQDEIKLKREARLKLKQLSQRLSWLDEFFINLMVEMEKQVMTRVYNEFNEIFQEFFNILIESDAMSIRLDDQFNPIIEQHGHELNFEDLSGGEKTSIALSYRLALNKVINELVHTIKTKNLIILDEPTDGFSSKQLDRVQQVLNALDIKQSILVSHESKVESFVDHVLRVEKRDNVSSVN
ncbi:AAA family ATPase [Candidatus Woesearchaeota archaeon]|nr:AAA family ATPase [Candidatus Woesearchaeota archaeon]